MKKLNLIAGVLLLSTSAFSAVGYINTEEIFQKYSKVNKYKIELEKEKEVKEVKLNAEKKKFQEQVAEVQKKGDNISAKDKESLQKLAVELEKKIAVAQKEFRIDDLAKEQIILNEIKASSEAVAKSKNLDMIVNSAAVITGGEDVTATVLATLEKNFATKK